MPLDKVMKEGLSVVPRVEGASCGISEDVAVQVEETTGAKGPDMLKEEPRQTSDGAVEAWFLGPPLLPPLPHQTDPLFLNQGLTSIHHLQPSTCFIGTQPCSVVYILSLAAFVLQQQS